MDQEDVTRFPCGHLFFSVCFFLPFFNVLMLNYLILVNRIPKMSKFGPPEFFLLNYAPNLWGCG